MPCPVDRRQAGESPAPEDEDWTLIPDCNSASASADAEDDYRANDAIYADILALGKASGMTWIAEYDVLVEGTTKGKDFALFVA
jgi:hypothetical protein